MGHQIPSWLLENSAREWTTDVRAKIAIVAGPTYSYSDGVGSWYAALAVPPFPDNLWECEHSHTTPDAAYYCARTELEARLGLR